ncbi:MAG: hypothetical protein GYA56_09060 [Geobacteraceae bacterium]|nr:hypothetical protein [Geobacteraceae bacterium]
MKILLGALILLMSCRPVSAGAESLILFLDGARIEKEFVARKGYLEAPLPAKALPDSLRVRPVGDVSVLRVQVAPIPPERRHDKEFAALEERRASLLDRVKVLEEREALFKAAVKSQSSRALRRTKNNPDPLETARKGTNFALAQMESAHAARRKAEKELSGVEARLAAVRKESDAGSAARIWLSRADGRVRVSCLVSGISWTPWYDFRLTGSGSAETIMRAKLPSSVRSASVSVVPLSLADAFDADPVLYPVSADLASIASFRLPLTQESLTRGPVPFLSFTISNSSGKTLPEGEACGYWQGEYLGRTHFKGCRAGESLAMVIGRQP